MNAKKIIPIFYACDDNYLPYLGVSLLSLKENRNKEFVYKIHVLHAGVDKVYEQTLMQLAEDNFEIYFNNVTDNLNAIGSSLLLRDYYTTTTYYRIFIAETFPQYDKAVYLDCDTLLLGDVSELYSFDLGDCFIGGVPDEAVQGVEPFRVYVKKVLGIEPERYFNAGIIVMNLKKFREEGFYCKFNDLLSKYKFIVAQDQDYLNVICKGSIKFLPLEWNKMPIEPIIEPKLIHYNLTRKPWHHPETLYSDIFWEYAKKSAFYEVIIKESEEFSAEDAKKDMEIEMGLLKLAILEAEKEDNYYNLYVKEK